MVIYRNRQDQLMAFLTPLISVWRQAGLSRGDFPDGKRTEKDHLVRRA